MKQARLWTQGILEFEFELDASDRGQLAPDAKRQPAPLKVARPAEAQRAGADFTEAERQPDPLEIARRAQAQMAKSANRGRPLSATESVLRVMQGDGLLAPEARA